MEVFNKPLPSPLCRIFRSLTHLTCNSPANVMQRTRKDFLGIQDALVGLENGDAAWMGLSEKLKEITDLLSCLADKAPPKTNETFVVAVCGHFSSGKSSFLNAVIGTDLCPVDTEITTKANTRFVYGDPAIFQLGGTRRRLSTEEYQTIVRSPVKPGEEIRFEVRLKNPILKRFVFVDTPGRGADDATLDDRGTDDYYRDSKPSCDDAASDAACKEADCIVYLSQPKNIHEEDEAFLCSRIAHEKPVLVVMPQVDRLKADGPQLVATYQANIEAIRKENKSISTLYCCGGFGRKKKNPALREDSLQKIFLGLEDLYQNVVLLRKKASEIQRCNRADSLKKVEDLVDSLKVTTDALHLGQREVDEFDRNLAKYYSREEGSRQWLNLLVKEANVMVSHFRNRASSYCYRKEYDWTTNHAAVNSSMIRTKAEEFVVDMITQLRSTIRVVLDTMLGDNGRYKQADAEIETLRGKVSGFVAEAVDWWDEDYNSWPGDTWYWWNSDVDRVGREAVWAWANDRLVTHCQKITQDADTSVCAYRIERIIGEAISEHCKLRDRRLEWLSRLDGIVEEFKKRKGRGEIPWK